jgi:hypothetical protein
MVVLGASGLGLHAMAIAKARGAGVIAIDGFRLPTGKRGFDSKVLTATSPLCAAARMSPKDRDDQQ